MGLKEMRKKRGYTQFEMAKKMGISNATLVAYEVGARDINSASLYKLFEFADFLECDIKDILTDKDLIKRLGK